MAAKKRTRSLERPVLRSIIAALELHHYFFWRANSGSVPTMYKGKEGRMQLAIPGTPDILVLLPGGRLMGLEVKSATGTQQESQKLWQAQAEALGAGYALVRSAGEALRAIEVFVATGEQCARGRVGSTERVGGVSK